MGRENGVVGFYNRGRNLRRWENAEVQFALLSVINRKSFEKESAEARASTTAYGVEDKETLEAVAVLCEFPDLVQDGIDVLLANGVVTASVVVGSILLTGDHLIGMEELRVFAHFDVIDYRGFQVEVDAARDVFATAGFAEEGIKGKGLVRILSGFGEGSVGVDAMLEAVKFPAGGTDLYTSLTNVERDYFAHCVWELKMMMTR